MSGGATSSELMQELHDIEAIKQVKARYVRCADTQDWEGFASVLTEDYLFDSEAGVLQGRDQVVAMVSKSLQGASTVHHVFAPEISFTGPDSAEAVWPMEDYVRMSYEGQAVAFHGCGHYWETYVRTDDGWRLRTCKLTRLRVDPIDGTVFRAAG
jgi:uncharacterized protein (TIGR02246 family)